MAVAIKTVNADYLATSSDNVILATTGLTVTLPSANGIVGRVYTIKNISASSVVRVEAQPGEYIDGSSVINITTSNEFIKIISDGSTWYIIGGK
jgi:threonine aldolase